MSIRAVKKIVESTPTLEGAGVRLRRAFGFGDTDQFDPFLLFDDFRNERPPTTSRDFRGIRIAASRRLPMCWRATSITATVSGNRGTLGAGDVQWMTAGSGILHQEMPQGDAAGPHARLPVVGESPALIENDEAALSGCSLARHSRIGEDDGTQVRVVVGDFWGKRGPVDGIAADPRYLDISVPPGRKKTFRWNDASRVCLCVRRRGHLP